MNDGDERPPRLTPPAFWLALAFGLAMVLAAAAVAWVLPARPERRPAGAPAAALTGPLTRGRGTARPNTGT